MAITAHATPVPVRVAMINRPAPQRRPSRTATEAPARAPTPAAAVASPSVARRQTEIPKSHGGQDGTGNGRAGEPHVRGDRQRTQSRVPVDPPQPLGDVPADPAQRRSRATSPPTLRFIPFGRRRFCEADRGHQHRRGEVAHGVDQHRQRWPQQRDHRTGERRAAPLGDGPGLVDARVGRAEQRPRHHPRQEGLRGGVSDQSRRPEDGHRHHHPPQVQVTGQSQHGDGRQCQRARHVGDDHQGPPSNTVDQGPHQQAHQQVGQPTGGIDQADFGSVPVEGLHDEDLDG